MIQQKSSPMKVGTIMLRKCCLLFLLLLTACTPAITAPPAATEETLAPPAFQTPTDLPQPTAFVTPTPRRAVPNFKYIAMIAFENKEFGSVIGSPKAPYFNVLASSHTLLTQHYAQVHPSLPNYFALMAGDTLGVTETCNDCFFNVRSLPDLIEESGRTWKTYQEDMPAPCFMGDTNVYVQKHNPFVYFDPIRLDEERCQRSVVPFTQLDLDIEAGSLPNFMFIMPNICYSAHSCGLEMADAWLDTLLDRLVPALEAGGEPYLVIVTWDEGQSELSCCQIPEPAGGRIATILVSPQAKSNFQDDTPYTHYSILKTISEAWGLPYLGHAADDSNELIVKPWK